MNLPTFPNFAGPWQPALWWTAAALYGLAQALLFGYAGHRCLTLFRARGDAPAPPPLPAEWPVVTVQLPVFNEKRVVERLIDAVAAFDYPRERLEIQVLDDSTDETRDLAAAAVARVRATGVDIRHLVRTERDGFKAGALAAGLAVARGEFCAVFDADFLPAPDFLRRTVPHFADPEVGMVQARWTHLNRSRSALTLAQAVLLDAHFGLEHDARFRHRLFFNFNGTAGVWRRASIEAAGGWSHETLTEDLDLSYRAQLAGWRFVYDRDIVVPAELPSGMRAFQSQQRRWVRGSVQTARKVLGSLWRAPLPWSVRLEAIVHLTANFAYLLLLALALLMLPVLAGLSRQPAVVSGWLSLALLAGGALPGAIFLAAGQRRAGVPGREIPGAVLLALILCAGISVNNALAALRGLAGSVGQWERTPKTGEGAGDERPPAYGAGAGRPGWMELGLALYCASVAAWALRSGFLRELPFLALLATGFGWMAAAAFGERAGARSTALNREGGAVRWNREVVTTGSVAEPGSN